MIDVHIILAAPKQEAIKPLIQSEGFIIGVDGGASIALQENIDLDLVLGDFDSLGQEKSEVIKKYAKETFTFPREKDDTDVELALLYVLENIKTKNIYLYNWGGGRQDHLYSLFMLVLQKRFNSLIPKIQFVSKNNLIDYHLPGQYKLVKQSGMDYLSLILLTKVNNLTIENVKYPLSDQSFDEPRALISNEFLAEKADLSFTTGIIATIQSRDSE